MNVSEKCRPDGHMRGALETVDEDDITVSFLRYALIALRGYLREAQVYDAVQEMVKSEQGAVTFSAQLEGLSNAYVATFNAENEKWNEYPDAARRAVEVFSLTNIKPMRPLLLAIAAKMGEREAASSMKFLVSLGVRLLIASTTRSGSVELPLSSAAHEVFTDKISTAAALKKKLKDVTPSDEEFRAEFETFTVSNARLARYYLRSLEMAAKDESEPCFMPNDDRTVINLEHVLPKKPGRNWPRFTDEEVAAYSKRVGNLALLRASDNSGLRSDAFSDKKAVYADTPFVLTSQISDVNEWTPSTIEARQRILADLAVKAWPA